MVGSSGRMPSSIPKIVTGTWWAASQLGSAALSTPVVAKCASVAIAVTSASSAAIAA